jgi:type I restriction-modification system DNA methylase subunit
MAYSTNHVLLGLGDIAEIAGVGRSAVSNWRKRHETFPAAHQTGASGDLFAADEIERWLLENGKISTGLPPARLLWSLADMLRDIWSPEQIMRFYISGLVYLVACQRSSQLDQPEIPVDVPEELRWERLREQDPAERNSQIMQMVETLEGLNPPLHGLLTLGFMQLLPPAPQAINAVFDGLQAILDAGEDIEGELFNKILEQFSTLDRFSQQHATSDDLARLMTALVGPGGPVILDPAVGRGGLLLLAVLATELPPENLRAVGLDIDQEVVTTARAWFFIYDRPADLSVGNVLRMPHQALPKADTVLLDPPYGLRDWGDAELYRDENWAHGAPPPRSADFAWLQVALAALADGGRAVVSLQAGSASRTGREQRIRESMVKTGHVEAVIHLPSHLRMDMSLPLVLWILRGTAQPGTPVLLINASKIGTAGRTSRELTEDDVRSITDVVGRWRTGATLIEDDDRLIVVAVHPADLRNGALVPEQYIDPEEGVDLDALVRRTAELTQALDANRELLNPVIDAISVHRAPEGQA